MRGRTYRDVEIRNQSFILGPSFAVLSPASLDVSDGSVHDHDRKEDGIKPWEGRVEAGHQAPREREEEIACVVDLASFADCSQSRSVADYTKGNRTVFKARTEERNGNLTHPNHQPGYYLQDS